MEGVEAVGGPGEARTGSTRSSSASSSSLFSVVGSIGGYDDDVFVVVDVDGVFVDFAFDSAVVLCYDDPDGFQDRSCWYRWYHRDTLGSA